MNRYDHVNYAARLNLYSGIQPKREADGLKLRKKGYLKREYGLNTRQTWLLRLAAGNRIDTGR